MYLKRQVHAAFIEIVQTQVLHHAVKKILSKSIKIFIHLKVTKPPRRLGAFF